MEFAEGNFGLLQGALEYAKDTTPPVTVLDSDNVTVSNQPINYRFNWPGESAVIRYTTDGSTPNADSPQYQNQGARRPGEVLTVASAGHDDDQVVRHGHEGQRRGGEVADVADRSDGARRSPSPAPADGAVFTQGRPVPVSYACADDGRCRHRRVHGGGRRAAAMLPTGTPGPQTFTVTARDAAGNVTQQTLNYRVLDATNVDGSGRRQRAARR